MVNVFFFFQKSGYDDCELKGVSNSLTVNGRGTDSVHFRFYYKMTLFWDTRNVSQGI